jgi:hypothetical protein
VRANCSRCVWGLPLGIEISCDAVDGTRAAEDTRASLWEHNHKLFYDSGVIPGIVTAFKAEVDELLHADVNKDGMVDASEYYRFKVLNDGDASNDADTLEAAQSRQAAEGKTAAPESGEDGLSEPVPYFLVSVVKLLKELSEHAPSAAVIVRLGALQRCAQLVKVIADFREEVLLHALELVWNCLEHSFDAIGTVMLVAFGFPACPPASAWFLQRTAMSACR